MTKILILYIDEEPTLIDQIRDYVQSEFEIDSSKLDISTYPIHSLPRNDENRYSVEHLHDYTIVTDYYGISGVNVRRVENITDYKSIGEVAASFHIKPEVFWTDCPVTTKRWLNKLPSTFAYDTETTGLAIKDIGSYTMHSFSIDLVRSIVVIDTPETREIILNFLVETLNKIVCHNIAFDMRYPYRYTGKFFKDYEDTQLIAQAYMNHTGLQAYSLKALAGSLYGDWANAKTSFDLYEDSSQYENRDLKYFGTNKNPTAYNLPLVYYAGVDVNATLFLWQKFSKINPTWESVSMDDLLPITEPRYHEETPRYFYENVMKPLVKTTIELLETPMPIDMDIVKEIKQEALAQREPAFAKLQEFPKVKQYMDGVRAQLIHDFIDPLEYKQQKEPEKIYKHNIKDRTILCNTLFGTTHESWKVTDVKAMLESEHSEIMQMILDKNPILEGLLITRKAMMEYRSIPQQKLQHKIDNPLEYIDPKKLSINPNASQQMRGLYKFLGLESDVLTPKKEESFNKDVISEIAKTTSDEAVREIIEQVLLIAETKNLLSQYIPAYEHSNKDGFCYGALKFPGTISYRCSSAKGSGDGSAERGIPLLTLPGKTKRATVAKPGWILAASDFANLEGYVGALLMNDPTKKKILVDKYDSHCLHSSYYFTEEVERIMGIPFEDTLEFNQKFNEMRKSNKELDKLRSLSKGVSFGLVYGAYPKKVAQTLKQPLSVGEALFNRFHNDLYPESTKYKENYILPTTKQQGYIHLGLGARLLSNRPEKDIRSLGNATIQFWSILTLLAIHKVHKRIKKAGYEGKINIYSTVHDSIMAHMIDDPVVIKWYNDNLIECMIQNFIIDQDVQLLSNLDIGYSYDDLVEIPNNCSIEKIVETLKNVACV